MRRPSASIQRSKGQNLNTPADGIFSPNPGSRSQTEVVVWEDFMYQDELLILESVHLGTQMKYTIDFAPVDGKPSCNSER
jgi:hypothetical protein